METLKVIKIGGSIINNEVLLEVSLKQFSKIEGPKVISAWRWKTSNFNWLDKMNIPVQMNEGRSV